MGGSMASSVSVASSPVIINVRHSGICANKPATSARSTTCKALSDALPCKRLTRYAAS